MSVSRARSLGFTSLGFVEDERGGLLGGQQPVPLGHGAGDPLGLGRVTVGVEQLGGVLAAACSAGSWRRRA